MNGNRSFIPLKKLGILLLLTLPVVLCAQQTGYMKSTKIEKIDGRDFYVHKVLKGQTLYAISKLYESDLDSILFFNAQIKEGLKSGSLIQIPLPVIKTPQPVQDKERIKSVLTAADTLQPPAQTIPCESGFNPGPFNITLMMPFYLSEIDSIPPEFDSEFQNTGDLKSFRFIQFYEGLLMAVDSLINMGLSINLSVYDVDEDTNNIKKLFRNGELKKSDLIIGLLYGASFQKLAQYCKINKIPVINPLSNKAKHIEDNPYVFLANCTVTTMAEEIAEFMADKYYDNVIVMVNSGKENEKKSMKLIYDQLLNKFKVDGKPTQNIYLFSGEKDIQKVSSVLTGTDKNAVIILSNDELFVANIMRYLKEWAVSHSIMVFGMPGWLEFKSVESKLLVDLNFHSFGTSFIDYANPLSIAFVQSFRDQYKTEPGELAFQGFDVSFYFLNSMMKYGKDFGKCCSLFDYKGLQSRFIMRQTGNNGFENAWLNIYRIQDYHVINARD